VNFQGFYATNNPNLYCIEVDDAAWSTANWTNVDPQVSFSEDCTSSITENHIEKDIVIYPNPAVDYITIQNKTSENIKQINIYNMLGKRVLSTENISPNIDISGLSSGFYLLQIIMDNQVINRKINLTK